MKETVSCRAWFFVIVALLGGVAVEGHTVEHVISIMFENHSFDQMIGFLKLVNPEIDGLTGSESCPVDPQDPSKGTVKVTANSPYVTDPDPDHSLTSTREQVFGYQNPNTTEPPVPMTGFIKNYGSVDIMKMFSRTKVPTISEIGLDFAIFDHWYSGIPGPTMPNRLFFHSATSYGSVSNDIELIIEGYPQPTIFDRLTEKGLTWRNYFTDVPSLLVFEDLRNPFFAFNYAPIEEFYADCASGDLPTYTFIDPSYFKFLEFNATDQHPPHDVRDGEMLLADLYDAVRHGPKWNNTLFIVTYDEHGGFYDHSPTPIRNVTAPDHLRPPSNEPWFGFNRLGVRVPMIMASPWIPKGTVVHQPSGSQAGKHFSHSSFSATMKKMFGTNSFLTKRDAEAATFESVLSLKQPRTDCPHEMPRPGGKRRLEEWRAMRAKQITPENVWKSEREGKQSLDEITPLQYEFLETVVGLSQKETKKGVRAEMFSLRNEHEAAKFARSRVNEFLERSRKQVAARQHKALS